MKMICLMPLLAIAILLVTIQPVNAQNPSPDDALKIAGGGSFSKPKILSGMDKLGLAQTTIYFKTATTREIVEAERGAFGRRKTDGASVAGRITAYLETTDGELTEADFQELADHFYTYMCQKLQTANASAADWNTIAGTDFYKNEGMDLADIKKDMDQMRRKGQIYTVVNANKGSTLWRYNINGGISPGFAFGKLMKAAKFSKEVGAPVVFMHLVVDFADIWLDGDASSSRKEDYYKVTTTKKWKMDARVGPDVKVSTTGASMFFDEKSRVEMMNVAQEVHSLTPFSDGVSEDPNKEILHKRDNIFAKDFNMTPMVIMTTKDKYKAAAKKALENFADTFAGKVLASKK